MKRQQKYPETRTFHYYNANPKGRMTGDCVIRAICTAMEKPYEEVYRELLELALETGYSLASKENYGRYLNQNGWVKHKQPRKDDNTKYTGEEFCKEVKEYTFNYPDRIIAYIVGNHIVAIVYGKVWDIWDSTDGCIGNWWTKA